MNILLLGGTGRTGRIILREALERGHVVHALVRDRVKVRFQHPQLHLFEGNPAKPDQLQLAMQGCEAIINALNVSRVNDWPWSKLRTPTLFLSEIMKELIRLAPINNIKRLVFISAWGVAETRPQIPAWFRWFIEHSNIRFPYEDHERQEKLVMQTNLDWTGIRPAGLTNFKKSEVRVSLNNQPKPNLTISRASLASFTLDVLEKKMFVRQFPVVSSH